MKKLFMCLFMLILCINANAAKTAATIKQIMFPPTDKTVWAATVTSNSVWMKYLLTGANDPTGQWGIENQSTAAAWAYLYTGNKQYAANCWNALQPVITTGILPAGNNNNSIRIYLGLYSIEYVALSDYLTVAQQQQFAAFIDGVANRARTGFFTGNANGEMGEYLGLCLWSVVKGAQTGDTSYPLLQGTFNDSGAQKPYGGLTYDPALPARGSARNAIHDYFTLAQSGSMHDLTGVALQGETGGIWPEGVRYIDASLFSSLLFTKYIDRITGKANFPEIDAALPSIAQAEIKVLFNSLKGTFSWGDNENEDTINSAVHLTTMMLIADRLKGTQLGAEIQYLVNLWGKNNQYKDFSMRGYLALNPTANAVDPRTISSSKDPVDGLGIGVWRSGWSDDPNTGDTIFNVVSEAQTQLNHTGIDAVHRSIRVYRHGVLVLDHPTSYGGYGLYPDGNNTVVDYNMGVMWSKGQEAWESGLNYFYQRAATSGAPYPASYFNPPANFLSEQRGEVLCTHGATDVIFVGDRINSTNPSTEYGWPKRWRTADYNWLSLGVNSVFPYAPLQYITHTPLSPTVDTTTGNMSWTVGNQQVWEQRIATPENPQASGYSTIDESAQDSMGNYLYFTYGNVAPSVRKWQVRETYNNGDGYHFLFHVFSFQNIPTGQTSVNAPVSNFMDLGGGTAAVYTEPQGDYTRLFVFNHSSGTRLIGTGFYVSVPGIVKELDYWITGLDPSLHWQVSIDGKAPTALSLGNGGLAHGVFYGNGTHKFVFSTM